MRAIHARYGLAFAAAFIGLGAAIGSAQAITLPPGYGYSASQSAEAGVDGGVNNHQSSTTIGSVSTSAVSPGGARAPGTASASGSIGILPSPHLSGGSSVSFTAPAPAYNTSDGQYGSGAEYSGSLVYYFEIGGPTSSVDVNLKALASYSISALPSGGLAMGVVALSVFQLDPLGDAIFPRRIFDTTNTVGGGSYATPTAAQAGGFTENGTYNLFTNTVYQVGLQVIAEVAVHNSGASDPSATGGTASMLASLDPTFNIAAGVANADQYSFVFSDGIGNSAPPVAATPLPAGLLLSVTGFGALGVIGARGKRRSAAAHAA